MLFPNMIKTQVNSNQITIKLYYTTKLNIFQKRLKLIKPWTFAFQAGNKIALRMKSLHVDSIPVSYNLIARLASRVNQQLYETQNGKFNNTYDNMFYFPLF